jgi:hypothetical protein
MARHDVSSFRATRPSHRADATPCLRSVAVLVVVATVCAAAPIAHAGTDGQQVALDHFSDRCADGPPTRVVISGHNQDGRFVTWRQTRRSVLGDGWVLRGWWWRGAVRVSWVKRGASRRSSVIAYVPQYDDDPGADFSYEQPKDVVSIDCHGSLRRLPPAHIAVPPDGFHELVACGAVPEAIDEIWEGDDERFYAGGTWTRKGYVGGRVDSTYALGPADVHGAAHSVPPVVTNFISLPICPDQEPLY